MKYLQWNERKLYFKWERGLLLIESILCIALLVSVCFNNNVWWDEAYTYDMVTNYDWIGIIMRTAKDVHPPLYYFMGRIAVCIFGNGLFVLKVVSILSNAAIAVLGMTKIYKRFGLKTAVLFIFLSCFAPQLAFYGVQLRMYGWASFFVLASAVYGYEALCENRRSDWILFVAFSLGGAYTLYFACISISCIYLCMLLAILVKCRELMKSFFCAVLATIVGYLPWLVIFFTVTFGGLDGFREDLEEESIGEHISGFLKWSFQCGMEGDFLIYAGMIVLALLAIWLFNKERTNRIEVFWVTGLCIAPVYTIVFGKILNHLAGRMLLNRYIEPTLILIWLVCAIGLSRYKNCLFYAAAVPLLLMGIENYRFVYHDEYHVAPLIHETESFIENQMAPEDTVVYELEPYEIMYAYYMPKQELIYYENMDLAQYQGKSFWFIDAWGGYFDADTVERYRLEKEECGNFGIQSMDFKIYRITVNSDGK